MSLIKRMKTRSKLSMRKRICESTIESMIESTIESTKELTIELLIKATSLDL